ncbi:endonuclease MutS2 [[Clostridium] polysaccharolyticum]|uniref:Endonuclease MutS2 n=1 Tax=[Clostridium] polysaccharolyticum TaxID=29364 RepID=A0A1I0E8F1_9FIRM|nr:endonuclease MutS2 [[Clostridium] polysaccharolyticum]SET41267.1 DNA mismatch repair protein MutS2 [[Clostridium] polysaccharolyticum]
MNKKALKTLEFDKIIDKLKDLANTPLGKELCTDLLPCTDLSEIKHNLTETSDALSMIFKKGPLSFSGVRDVRSSLMRLDVGSVLSIEEILSISSLLNVTLRVKSFTRKENLGNSVHNEEEEYTATNSLTGYFDALEPLSNINNEIKHCIISQEEIADDASTALRQIRKNIKNTNNKVHDQLNSIVNSSRTMLQDALITMRNGRYCLPVKAEYRSSFKGMIHDQSTTGSTLFIEPMAIVKLNNELRELSLKEQDEIERILAELSNLIGEHLEELKINLEVLTKLDFIFAKASLSRQMRGSLPDFNEEGIIDIKKGRHPLIDPKKAVPIDIRLGEEFDLLMITGPNTGGKTVSLKTVGLFTLMGQAGLHIPAFDHSRLSVFEEVFADIGDEQSIEQSLSTFSSHMKNEIRIIENANNRSLCLFDELGAGTDPVEGAALAMAILTHLHTIGAKTIATTHYSELKLYALSTPGVENACCEFDVETLRPTYRLLIGIPGKSNAFAISSKLGLPDYIIEDAKARIDSDSQSFEDIIADLESSRVTIEKEQAEIAVYKAEIEELKKKLTIKNEKIDAAKEKILREANEKAREILQEAKDFADESIRKYNKWSKQSNLQKDMEEERAALRNKLNKTDSKLVQKTKTNKKNRPQDFKPGESVHVISLNVNGTVGSVPNSKGEVYVQMGILRSLINIHDLELIDEPDTVTPKFSKTGSGKIKMSKSLSVSPELNIIGKTVDEGIAIMDKYLDDAYLSHIPQVTIIHGRGTGALRNAVQQHLKKLSYIKSYRIGGFGEGDHGVTIVEFK